MNSSPFVVAPVAFTTPSHHSRTGCPMSVSCWRSAAPTLVPTPWNHTGRSLLSMIIGPPSPVMGPGVDTLGRLARRKSPPATPDFRLRTLSLGGWRPGADTNFQAPFVVKAPIGEAWADPAKARLATRPAASRERENRWALGK